MMQKKINSVCHIGPALYVQGGISSVLSSYKKLFNLSDENFVASYNGSFVKSLPILIKVCLKLLFCPNKKFAAYQIHTSSYGSFFRKLLISLCIRVRGKKYMVHIHGSLFDKFCGNANPVVKKMLRSYFYHAEKILILSGEMRNIVKSVAPEADNFEIIPNPCEFETEAPADLSLHMEPVKIVFSGRFGNRKGVYDLLAAFDKSSFSVPVKLYLFGDGEVEKVRNIVVGLSKKDMIEVSSWKKHAEYLELLPQFDLLILPSYAERFSMSLVEAEGLGLPVISTFVGGTTDIVEDGNTGIICEPGNIPALTKALEKLVNDKELRISMGRAGWKRVRENFTGKVVLEKLERVYEEIA